MMYILTNHVGDALRKGAPLAFTIPTSGAVPFHFSAGVLEKRQASQRGQASISNFC